MEAGERPSFPRKSCGCVIAACILLVGLIIFSATLIGLSFKSSDGESSPANISRSDDNCPSEAIVVTDTVMMQKWETCSANFSQLWKHSEPFIEKPKHQYMKKRHSFAVYVYTSAVQSDERDFTSETKTRQWRERYEPVSLYSSLSEAIQILKHSQVTCHSTKYKTDTISHFNITNQQVRFSTYILGLKEWGFASSATCFEVFSCFGADVTQYSTLKIHNQVLIPPYELFKVVDVQVGRNNCKVSYTLRSNMNCVYNRESSTVHPIDLELEFWLIFIIICLIAMTLLLPLVIVKVCQRKTVDRKEPSLIGTEQHQPY